MASTRPPSGRRAPVRSHGISPARALAPRTEAAAGTEMGADVRDAGLSAELTHGLGRTALRPAGWTTLTQGHFRHHIRASCCAVPATTLHAEMTRRPPGQASRPESFRQANAGTLLSNLPAASVTSPPWFLRRRGQKRSEPATTPAQLGRCPWNPRPGRLRPSSDLSASPSSSRRASGHARPSAVSLLRASVPPRHPATPPAQAAAPSASARTPPSICAAAPLGTPSLERLSSRDEMSHSCVPGYCHLLIHREHVWPPRYCTLEPQHSAGTHLSHERLRGRASAFSRPAACPP